MEQLEYFVTHYRDRAVHMAKRQASLRASQPLQCYPFATASINITMACSRLFLGNNNSGIHGRQPYFHLFEDLNSVHEMYVTMFELVDLAW